MNSFGNSVFGNFSDHIVAYKNDVFNCTLTINIKSVLRINCFFPIIAWIVAWVQESISQFSITCSKLTVKTVEQGVKYVQS